MKPAPLHDLDDSTEIRQVVLARPPAVVRGTLAVSIALCLAALLWATLTEADQVVKARGSVRPAYDAARVQVTRGGKVESVHFKVGSRVRAGEVMLRLEENLEAAELAKTERDLAAAREELDGLLHLGSKLEIAAGSETRRAEADVEVARRSLAQAEEDEAQRLEKSRHELETARARLGESEARWQRQKRLLEDGILSRDEYERLELEVRTNRNLLAVTQVALRTKGSALELAGPRVKAAEEALAVSRAAGAARLEEFAVRLVTQRGRIGTLEEEVGKLRHRLEECVLRAPAEGIVVEGDIRQGDVLEAGHLVASIATGGELRFDAWVDNSEIAGLHEGQEARVKLDAYPFGQFGTLRARIAFLGPDATVVREDGGRARSFYEVRLRLLEDSFGPRTSLDLGMTGLVEVIRGRKSLLALAVDQLREATRPR